MGSTRRRPSRALCGLVVGLVALPLAACTQGGGSVPEASGGGQASQAGGGSALPKTLVFSPLSLAPPALKGLSEGVKGYAGSQGWEVIVQDPNFDPNKQVQELNTVIDSGRVGAAWILAVAPPSMKDVISNAQAKKVPLLVNGRPDEYGFSGEQAGVTFDYIDYKAGGKALGEQMGACVTANLGGSAKVVYAGSAEGTAGKQEFDTAAMDALKAAAPSATVVQTIIAKDRTGAQTDMSTVLQGNPGVNAVMAANDEGALGAQGAADASGATLTCVSDFGGNDEVLKLVQSKKIFASVALQFNADLKQSFDTLVKMQADPAAKGLILTVPQKVVTANG